MLLASHTGRKHSATGISPNPAFNYKKIFEEIQHFTRILVKDKNEITTIKETICVTLTKTKFRAGRIVFRSNIFAETWDDVLFL